MQHFTATINIYRIRRNRWVKSRELKSIFQTVEIFISPVKTVPKIPSRTAHVTVVSLLCQAALELTRTIFLLQMRHPIQMKPADSENINGKFSLCFAYNQRMDTTEQFISPAYNGVPIII